MQASMYTRGQGAIAFNMPSPPRTPSYRNSMRTLHIYHPGSSESPYEFLKGLQSRYGRIQRAAICYRRENPRARAHQRQQQLQDNGGKSEMGWDCKVEFTTSDSATHAYNCLAQGPTPFVTNATPAVNILSSFVLDEEDSLVDLSQISNAQDSWTCSSPHAFHNIIQSGGSLNRSARLHSAGSESFTASAPADIGAIRPYGSEDDSCSSRAGSSASTTSSVLTSSARNGVAMNSPDPSLDGHSDTTGISSSQQTPQASNRDVVNEHLNTVFAKLGLNTTRDQRNTAPIAFSRRIAERVLPLDRPQSSENARKRLPPRMEALQQSMPSYASITSTSNKLPVAATAAAEMNQSLSNMPIFIHNTNTHGQSVIPNGGPRFNHTRSPSFTPSSPQPSRLSDSGSQDSYAASSTSDSTSNTNKSNGKKQNAKKHRQDKRLYVIDPHQGPRPTDWMLSDETLKTREVRDARFMQLVTLGVVPGRTKAGWAQARRPGKRDRDAAKAKLREAEEEREKERLKALLGDQMHTPALETTVH